jgi:hypothetical protein
MSQRFLSGMAAALLVLGLSACGDGDDGPVTTPPPEIEIGQSDGGGAEPSDGGAESDGGGSDDGSTDAAPDIPAPDPADYPGMDEETPEGAEQAVRFYFANIFWSYQTGDTDAIDGLYAETCEACEGFRGRIENQPAGEYWSETEVSDLNVTHVESENFDLEVGYMFTVGRHSEPAKHGGEPVEFDAIDYTAVAGVDWAGDGWVIAAMSFDESRNG